MTRPPAWVRLGAASLLFRPTRTAVLLFGFALGVAVMVVLLAVGEAILDQARDPDLSGGGDVVLLPAGIDLETLKVGGLSSLYFHIENARFLMGLLTTSPRFTRFVAAASPTLVDRVAYVVAHGETLAVEATGVLPDEEARVRGPAGGVAAALASGAASRAWSRAFEAFEPWMDAFHEPQGDEATRGPWAEWHYFNFVGGPGEAWGTLTIMRTQEHGAEGGSVSLVLREGGRTRRFRQEVGAERVHVSTTTPDLEIGGVTVRYGEGRYHVRGTIGGAEAVRLDLVCVPEPGRFHPPVTLETGGDGAIGYVVPVVGGEWEGTIRATGDLLRLDGVRAYHDHNWGRWGEAQWDWGQVIAEDAALFYGALRRGTADEAASGDGLRLLLFERDRLLNILAGDRPRPRGRLALADPDLAGLDIPASLDIVAVSGQDSVALTIAVEDAVPTQTPHGTFVQLKGRATGAARTPEGPLVLDAPALAEIFLDRDSVAARDARPAR